MVLCVIFFSFCIQSPLSFHAILKEFDNGITWLAKNYSCQLPFHIPFLGVSWTRPTKDFLFCFCRYRKWTKEAYFSLNMQATPIWKDRGSLATLAFHKLTSSTGMLTHSKLTIEDIFDLLINHGDVGKEERNSYPARLNERSRFRFMLSLNTDCWHSY